MFKTWRWKFSLAAAAAIAAAVAILASVHAAELSLRCPGLG
jgi:hypothetical protein